MREKQWERGKDGEGDVGAKEQSNGGSRDQQKTGEAKSS